MSEESPQKVRCSHIVDEEIPRLYLPGDVIQYVESQPREFASCSIDGAVLYARSTVVNKAVNVTDPALLAFLNDLLDSGLEEERYYECVIWRFDYSGKKD